jgi:hypothetical protein
VKTAVEAAAKAGESSARWSGEISRSAPAAAAALSLVGGMAEAAEEPERRASQRPSFCSSAVRRTALTTSMTESGPKNSSENALSLL